MTQVQWKIERDNLGDIKVSVPRSLFVVDNRPVMEWTVVGVAWSNRDTPECYGVYDIRRGGGPLSTRVAEIYAIQHLIELARIYAEEGR